MVADQGLLRLAGRLVKWGAPDYASPAEVTYAFLTTARTFPDARNCGVMVPVTDLLARSGIATEDFQREVHEAFRLWAEVTNLRFSRVDDAEAADIVIGAQAGSEGVAYTNVFQGARGAGPIDRIAKSTICLDPSERWEIVVDGDPATYNVRYAVTHEIGHAIGLDHLGRDGGIMGFAYRETMRSVAEIRLASADIAAVTALYGRTDHRPVALPVPSHPPVLPPACGAASPRLESEAVAACALINRLR